MRSPGDGDAAPAGVVENRGDGLEVAGERARRDDLEEAGRLVAGVPERVRDAARLGHQLARAGLDLRPAHERAEATAEHERVLVRDDSAER